jgi:(1->4)-alpha-D-glucan 1-alpha-D-glucosylmutase
MADWRDGRIKQAITHRALRFRASQARLFAEGSYVPLKIEGHGSESLLAFARQHEDQACITIISRLAARHGLPDAPMVSPDAWRGTSIVLPRSWSGRSVRDVFDGEAFAPVSASGRMRADLVLRHLPVSLLELR